MRPFRSFLLLLIILICFAGLSYLLPWDLNLPRAETLIPGELIPVLSQEEYSADTSSAGASADIIKPVLSPSTVAADSAINSPESLSKYPLELFLDKLRLSGDQVRILYYGDSQIEGDRITSYLRRYLRNGKKGSGPGLFLPVMPVTYTKSFYVRASPNWRRYSYLSFRNGEIKHNDFGPFMAFCRYMPDGQISTSRVKSWVRITPSVFSDSTESNYEFLRIFYRNKLDKITIEVKAGDNPVIADTLGISNDINEFVCPLFNSKNILIDFAGRTSPDIYGISIESRNGVIVDNIPQRGSAGLEFTMVDKASLRRLYSLLKPDLIVLHYGLNLATNIRDDYLYYEKGLVRQILLLKEVSPESLILVIGLTDMAYQEGIDVKSYPNISKIIDAQRKASSETGVVFWDAHSLMGGNGSIIRWFSMDPPLAKKDFIHLTDQGADTLAKIMAHSLFTSEEPEVLTAGLNRRITSDTLNLKGIEQSTGPEVIMMDKNTFFNTLVSLILRYDQDKPFIFSAPAFWIFFLFVIAGFSIVYKRLFIRNLYLFLVSLFFYYKTGGLFLLLLLVVTLIDYFCGIFIYNSKTRFGKRSFLILSIISNLGILAYFKYTGFFIQTLNDLLGTQIVLKDFLAVFSNSHLGTSFDISSIILPVGISFFTFQSLSYTFDMYRQKLEPVRNILDFGFYVSFFPQLVAGPIVRASEFIPQLYNEYSVSKREFSHAVFLILKGLIKKIIISDFIAVNFVDRIFDLPTAHSGLENLLAVYGYGLQIYCDFSGYTDIAIGLALILGFRLPVNFNSPYKAASVDDFWKRWHISLSRWLKDYLYISLGGNRKGKLRTIINLMITMLLGGLWHGANLRFIIWGGLHGIGLVISRLKRFIFGAGQDNNRIVKAIMVFMTFQFVSFCWIFFRAHDMHAVGLILRQIFTDFLPSSFKSLFHAYSAVFTLIAAGYLIHFLPEKIKESYRGFFIKIPVAAQLLIVLLIAFLLYQMRTTEIMPFIYFRF